MLKVNSNVCTSLYITWAEGTRHTPFYSKVIKKFYSKISPFDSCIEFEHFKCPLVVPFSLVVHLYSGSQKHIMVAL